MSSITSTTLHPAKMPGFTCNLCLHEFTNQFKFFEHLKGHYDKSATLYGEDSSYTSVEDFKPETEEVTTWPLPTSSYSEQNHEIIPDELIIAEDPNGLVGSVENILEESEGTSIQICCPNCNKIVEKGKTYETHLAACQVKPIIEESVGSDHETSKVDLLAGIQDPNCLIDHSIGIDGDVTDEIIKKINKHVVAAGQMCGVCQKCFPTKSKRDAHLRSSHPEFSKAKVARLPELTRTEVLKCTLCERIFNHRNSLVYHMRSHTGERPHKCDMCDKSFFATSALKVHKRLHSGEKPYKCETCDRAFRQWGDLKYHVISIHSDVRQYQCEFCGKDFARKYSLIVHRRIHTGERNYKCDFCGKCFRAASYLQNHRRIHTGEKPHTCMVCGKPFRVRSDMKRHLTSHRREIAQTGLNQPKEGFPAAVDTVIKTISQNNEIFQVGSHLLRLSPENSSTGANAIIRKLNAQLMAERSEDVSVNDELLQAQYQITITKDDLYSEASSSVSSMQSSSAQDSNVYAIADGSLDTVTIRDVNSGTLYVLRL